MVFPYQQHFQKCLDHIHKEKRYRRFLPLEKNPKIFPAALSSESQHPIILWSSNDYLGLGQSPQAIQAMQKQASLSGVSSGGTRNISGTHPLHTQLETLLATLHQKPKALLFNSGYMANQWSLAVLGTLLPDVLFFSDSENHASLIEGMRSSKAQKAIFRHNDMNHLHTLLKEAPDSVPKVIVCESVYSMSGDTAPLEKIIALARTYSALIYLDEVHAVGLYGRTGGGLAEEQNLSEHIDLIQGTLGKAFGTLGGYVAGSEVLIDLLRSRASGFIFSTSLPPPLLAASLCNVQRSMDHTSLREEFWRTVQKTKRTLKQDNIPVQDTNTHIIPVMIAGSDRCQKISQALIKSHGIYAQAINYPTVPQGTERLRLTPLRGHTNPMIQDLSCALQTVFLAHEKTFSPLQKPPRGGTRNLTAHSA